MPHPSPVRTHEAAPDLVDAVRVLPWVADANCATADPELFFPVGDGSGLDRVAKAKAVCRRCIVLVDCLAYAMAHPPLEGVWGGLTQRERARRRSRLAKRAQA